MQHVFAFAILPDNHYPRGPNQPKRFNRPDPDPREPDHRVLVASAAAAATAFALLWLIASVTVP